ncbi:hypothetical protein [Variovorax boronicumulans]|uniref:hypothetical protein n=1 Tax=Variovorax boronicumulans TaxID=436515 RepID=UPI0012E4A4C8|nr:hypothetical protein [Variovorax boronicumulans]GER21486.1 hypothetical protein VCH24_65430 [Variovorax boronicumulans]
MKQERPIHYEPHPVTAERKAELVARGVQIVDAIYKPADVPSDVLRINGPTVAEFVAAGYLASNYPPSGYESRSTPEEIAAAVDAQKAKVEGQFVDFHLEVTQLAV